jgi:hypothetical protein
MATFTKPFGFFYKHFPSTSYADTPLSNGQGTLDSAFNWTDGTLGWYDSSSVQGVFIIFTRVSRSFYGFPEDASLLDVYRAINHTDATTGSYRALPWGSAACDFLWNIKNSEWYFDEPNFGIGPGNGTNGSGTWQPIFTSRSFFETYYPGATGLLGSPSYNITSSWIAYDPKLYPRADGDPTNFWLNEWSVSPGGPGFAYNGYVVPTSLEYSTIPPAFNATVYTSMSYQLGRAAGSGGTGAYVESSSIDLQPFYRAGGAAITRADVSSSLATASLYSTSTSTTNLGKYRQALKSRRLFFPTAVSASGTTKSQDYWLKEFTGFRAIDLFTENGGIYQVDFTLKRDLTRDMFPDQNTFLSIFIHDVRTQAPTPVNRIAGAAGWYPPDSNIVKIFNGSSTTPVMQFINNETGYLHEKFSVTLIQYGTGAQLCFEVSGSTASDSYFGCIIDDVSFCKVGVTTDPNYIKPETGGGLPSGVSSAFK